MEVLLGTYTIALFGVSIFIATLTYITYKLLASYLHKWYEMKPIPEVPGTYPFIGNALQFKTNAGGKKAINMLRLRRLTYKHKSMRHMGTHVMHNFKKTHIKVFFFYSWFQISLVKFRSTPLCFVIYRCLNSGLE